MGTSEQYIKMCEKAGEIQALKEYYDALDDMENVYPYCFIDTNRDIWHKAIGYDEKDNIFDKTTWLPRQDQLQETLGGYEEDDHNNLLYDFNEWWSPWRYWDGGNWIKKDSVTANGN